MTWQKLRRLKAHEHPSLNPDPAQRPASEMNVSAVWLNDLYEVSVEEGHRSIPEDEVPWLPPVTYLSIKRRDKAAIHDWRHLQTIKNELCGVLCDAVEIYPSEARLHDVVNQYHLWVFPEGFLFPYGFSGRGVSDEVPDEYVPNEPRQRPFEEGTRVTSSERKRARRAQLKGGQS